MSKIYLTPITSCNSGPFLTSGFGDRRIRVERGQLKRLPRFKTDDAVCLRSCCDIGSRIPEHFAVADLAVQAAVARCLGVFGKSDPLSSGGL
jgi:hypothetical protein